MFLKNAMMTKNRVLEDLNRKGSLILFEICNFNSCFFPFSTCRRNVFSVHKRVWLSTLVIEEHSSHGKSLYPKQMYFMDMFCDLYVIQIMNE